MKRIVARLVLSAIISIPILGIGYVNGSAVVGILDLPIDTFEIPIILIVGILTLAVELGVIFGSIFLFVWAKENA